VNSLRVILNILLALLLLSGGAYLLGQRSFFLSDRWSPESGTLFHGVTLYLLAFGLIFLGIFAGAVAYCWIRGILPMSDRNAIRPHPAYKGAMIVRFWYLVLPAILFILAALFLADKAPNPSLQPTGNNASSHLFQATRCGRLWPFSALTTQIS
jgi:heme/copper-type cytochrome/quinol oxidase subunit 2